MIKISQYSALYYCSNVKLLQAFRPMAVQLFQMKAALPLAKSLC